MLYELRTQGSFVFISNFVLETKLLKRLILRFEKVSVNVASRCTP